VGEVLQSGTPAGRRRGSGRRRDRRSIALVLVGGLLINVSALCLWSWRSFASSQGFADVATDMLKEPAVRELVAHQIVQQVEDQSTASDVIIAARPVIEQVVEEVVGTTAFQGMFHAAVRQLHSSVFAGLRSHLLVEVPDAVDLVASSLNLVNPSLAAAIPDSAIPIAVGISQSSWVARSMSLASLAGWLSAPLLVAGFACCALAVRGASDRRRAFEWIGLCLFISGVGLFVLLFLGLQMVAGMGNDPTSRTALRAVFWSVTHVLNVEAKVLMVTGAVVWVAAANAAPGQIRRRARFFVEQTRVVLARPLWRFAACGVLIAAALFAMAWPAAAGAVLVRIVAFVAFVAGAVGLLDLLGSRALLVDEPEAPRRHLPLVAAEGLASVILVPVVLLGGALAVTRAAQPASAASPNPDRMGCNGLLVLCDRRLDEVMFAGTHNSMAASRERGWNLNTQQSSILGQLAEGVRALMIDFHYGYVVPGSGVVRTDVASEVHLNQQEALPELSTENEAIRRRALAAFGAAADQHDVYLCHNYCELGATKAVTALRQVASFLRENPNEVLIILVQDQVRQEDAVRVLEDSGLARRAWTWTRGTPLPTLRQMIDSRRNVLIAAEYEGGNPPWYHNAFRDLFFETEYKFNSIDAMSCTVGRGDPTNPLFIVNHWISTGLSSVKLAAEVNGEAVLRARLDRCTEALHHRPNVVAVNFSGKGDLHKVVARYNAPSANQAAAGPTTQAPR
jgi:hypothetical protein